MHKKLVVKTNVFMIVIEEFFAFVFFFCLVSGKEAARQ